MKKIISLAISVLMVFSSFILSVSAETEPGTEPEKIYDTASSDTNKITDLEQIAGLLKKYIDENHPGDATVAIYDEDGSLHVTFRKTAVSEDEFDGKSIWRNMAEYLKENNVDPSYISNKFNVEFLADVPDTVVSTVTTGDIDLNGTIDVTDLTELSLALIGDKELSDDQQKAADVDGDGAVTLADLARLQQYLSKKIDKL